MKTLWIGAALAALLLLPTVAQAAEEWEVTLESEAALERGLEWLAANQGKDGNWGSNELGLVAMGALAFLSAGHTPGEGDYGENIELALDYILENAQPNGLLNIAGDSRDTYNHGLATFVIGQAYGMTEDEALSEPLAKALEHIVDVQCDDGGWDYRAKGVATGHDLSLAVVQARALLSGIDAGLDVPPAAIALTLENVLEHYSPAGLPPDAPEERQRAVAGQFMYQRGQQRATVAMAAAGVVCLTEFGEGNDWRIAKSMEIVREEVADLPDLQVLHETCFDPFTLWYVSQACYHVGGETWEDTYPRMRDNLVASQIVDEDNARDHGRWAASMFVQGLPGEMYATAIGCYVLAMPQRNLPVLQGAQGEALPQKE